MNFSNEWNDIYAKHLQMTRFPWSDLVSYVFRYVKPKVKMRVLELGCGPGANIPLFEYLKADYYALEGSASVVKKIQKTYPHLKQKVKVGDFTLSLPFNASFDLIFDRAAMTHNSTAAIEQSIELIYHTLKPGAFFVGIDWFSTAHSDFKLGKVLDVYTKTDIPSGQFKGVGRVHFSSQKHLLKLFKKFKPIVLEHKKTLKRIPDLKHQFASWNFVFQKN